MNNANRKIQFDYETPLNTAANPQGSPERNMLMSLLERAILDFVGNNPKEIEAANSWLFEEEDSSDDVFSFLWICASLDLNPRFVRETVKAMPKRGANKVAPWYFSKTL